jgi:hypothetical protein
LWFYRFFKKIGQKEQNPVENASKLFSSHKSNPSDKKDQNIRMRDMKTASPNSKQALHYFPKGNCPR